MFTVGQLAGSPLFNNAAQLWPEMPVYARLPGDPAGVLRQIDGVGRVQILTSAGPHDVLVIAVSDAQSAEMGT